MLPFSKFASVAVIVSFAMMTPAAEIVIENSASRLILDSRGYANSLVDKATGEELLLKGTCVPFATLTQDRPYDNEFKLMLPAKPWTHKSNRIERRGDELRIGFEDEFDTLVLKIVERPQYLGFTLVRIDYDAPDFGEKRKTEIDALSVLRLPLKRRAHFGSTLNVTWDERSAAALLAADVETRVEAETGLDGGLVFWAGTELRAGLKKLSAALVVSPMPRFLDAVSVFERDFNLPRGVESRRRTDIATSCYYAQAFRPEELELHLATAREGGFGLFMFDLPDFVKSSGTYELKDCYPNGLKDLAAIGRRVRAAGFGVGLHGFPTKVLVTDPLATTNLDPRLNVACAFVLAESASPVATDLLVEGNAGLLRPENRRRLMAIGRELIDFTAAKVVPNSGKIQLTGCVRGARGTTATAHAKGERALHLDVDDWPIWIRANPHTSLPVELADRIAAIWKALGGVMFYFDGAEDVPPPYWHHVPRAQLVLYNRLDPKPLYCETALKSHFGWHLNSRGNAFDIFSPERIEAAMRACNLRCAALDAENFSCVDFGWLNMRLPEASPRKPERDSCYIDHNVNLGIGMQMDHFEFVFSKAVAWNSPVTVQFRPNEIKYHPHIHDNLAVISRWERARREHWFTDAELKAMRDPDLRHFLLDFGGERPECVVCRPIFKDAERPLRAFSFTRGGKSGIVCWNFLEAGAPDVDLGQRDVERRTDGGRTILISSVAEAELVRTFKEFSKRLGKSSAVELESRTATVEFRGEGEWNGGAITSFTCADGRNFAAKKASELFAVDGVRLGDPKNVKRSVNSSMTRECKIASAADSITLTYTGFKEVLEKAVCTVRADATDGMLHWRITVEPKPGWAITEVIYPRMALSKQLGASGEDDVIAHGGRQWGAVHNPGKTWNPKTWDGSRLTQPGDLFAQFACYYDAAGGFYTQAQDESALEAKAYWIYARDAAIMSEWHWREWIDSPRELPYDLVTGSFKGPEGEPTEWMDAADIYKRWAMKQRWCRTPFRDRKDLPEWLRSAPAMVRFYREWLSTPKHVDAWFTGHWRKNFGDVPLVGAVWGWEKHGIWITPDYFPAYPSDEAFGEVVAAMHRNNAHLFPWPSGYHWTLTHTKLPDGTFKYASTNEFKAVEHLAVRNEDGSIMMKNPSWYEGGAYADLCRGDARARTWWTRNVSDKLVERGAELIQFDQVNGGRHPPCWSKDHGHVPCAGRWWAESMRQQLDEIQASAAKLGTNLVLGFEDANEFYLDRVGIQDYRDVEISTSNRSVVSVWNYLYHEFVPTFQSNVKQDAWSCAHYAVDGQIPFILPYFANLSDAPAIPNCKFDQVEAGEAVGWNQKHALRKGGKIELALGRGPQGMNAMRLTAKRGERAYLSRSNYVNGEPAFVAGAKYRMSCLAKVNSPKAKAYVGDSVFTLDWKYLSGVSVPLDGCTSGWQRVSKVYTLPKNCEIHHYAVSVSEGEVEVTDLLLEREVAGGGWKPVILSGDTDYLKFMRQWVKLYHGEGRDFLAYGRRIRPPRVKCGTVVHYFGGSSKPFHLQVEAVCSAAYETLDGKRRVLALANGSKTEQTASWIWKGESASVTLKPGELRLVAY